ncbi:radical SAM/SPASM domain-containing protein [Roseospirillum parvum]|uniref:Radical SAM core domain-containing protein n=1 Tax=Roseospirillum parvum TaxID=83401 RepID=A0A1G8ESE7_9PROT|nr:radical SAM protein [Roseospirillum parvum]SDH72828.1 uncharacterized protein SAMN05421742_11124 [Roseospirillum parvum]
MPGRLTLVLAHACNLACRYCYAAGGDFGLGKGLMAPTLAERAVQVAWQRLDGLGEVFLFGGEPLLARPAMEAAIAAAQALARAHGQPPPRLSMVTNGTLVDADFAALAAAQGIAVTVSLDGPPALHDANRRHPDGRGSQAQALAGIETLRAAGVTVHLEATYTAAHRAAGWSPDDLAGWLESLGSERIIISEDLEDRPEDAARFAAEGLNLTAAAIDRTLASGQPRQGGLLNALDAILCRPALLEERFCGAGVDTLAINPLGEVYPCHMLNGQRPYRLGTVAAPAAPARPVPVKTGIAACLDCDIRRWCRRCPARMILTGELADNGPDPIQCQAARQSFALTAHFAPALARRLGSAPP